MPCRLQSAAARRTAQCEIELSSNVYKRQTIYLQFEIRTHVPKVDYDVPKPAKPAKKQLLYSAP